MGTYSRRAQPPGSASPSRGDHVDLVVNLGKAISKRGALTRWVAGRVIKSSALGSWRCSASP